MTVSGIKVFQGLSVRNKPTFIDDKHTPDCGNVLVNSPIGALSNIEGIEKYNSVGYGEAIVAIHQLNGHIFSLSGDKLYEGIAILPVANAGIDQSKNAGDTVTLDGSESTDATSYLWEQISGVAVSLSDATAESPTFTMLLDNVSFRLTATNSFGNDTDEVTITRADVVSQKVDQNYPDTSYACSTNLIFGYNGNYIGTVIKVPSGKTEFRINQSFSYWQTPYIYGSNQDFTCGSATWNNHYSSWDYGMHESTSYAQQWLNCANRKSIGIRGLDVGSWSRTVAMNKIEFR